MRERLNAPCATEGSTFYGLNVSAEPGTIFSLIRNKQKKQILYFHHFRGGDCNVAWRVS
jgi:hypothetical protein